MLHYSSKLHKESKNVGHLVKNKNANKIFFTLKNDTREKRLCYIILSDLLSHYKSCTWAGRVVAARASSKWCIVGFWRLFV